MIGHRKERGAPPLDSVQLASGRRPAASMDDLVRRAPAMGHVSGRLAGVSDRDSTDGSELVGHAERLSYCVDPVDGDAKEAGAEPFVDGGQQDQQGSEAGIDVPVRRWPPGLGADETLVGLGVAVEVCVLVGARDDDERGFERGGEPLLGSFCRSRGVSKTGDIFGSVLKAVPVEELNWTSAIFSALGRVRSLLSALEYAP